jgi:major vault protein
MTLLYPNEYIHVLDNNTGEVRTVMGPQRFIIASNEQMIGSITNAKIIYEDEYVIIKNPYDEKLKKCIMGDREVKVGPCVIYLHFNESIETIEKIHLLKKNQALRLRALVEHDGKKAGYTWQIEGERVFIPNKYTQVVKTLDAFLLPDNEGNLNLIIFFFYSYYTFKRYICH